MDREGMLIHGFDKPSLFYTYYNHPYYVTQMERRGYVKEVDWLEYRVTIPDKPVERIDRMADMIRKRYHLHTIDLDHLDRPLSRLVEDVFKLYNETYLALFGVVALTPKQVEKYVREFLPMVQGRTTSFVYNDKDELVITNEPLDYDAGNKYYHDMFDGLDFPEAYKVLSKEIRNLGETIPPLINSYMNLSPSMKIFGTAVNHEFGGVEETGILIVIQDIYPEKIERYTNPLKQLMQMFKDKWKKPEDITGQSSSRMSTSALPIPRSRRPRIS